MKQMIGSWAFLVGVVLAVVFGFIGMDKPVAIVLVILGLLIGLLNITDKDIKPFLMSGAILVIVSSLGLNSAEVIKNIVWFANILSAMMLIFVPATVIVALKSVFNMHKA